MEIPSGIVLKGSSLPCSPYTLKENYMYEQDTG